MNYIMTRIRSAAVFVLTLALAVAPTFGLLVFSAGTAQAQDAYLLAAARLANGDPILYGWSAISTHAPILIRYTGTGAGGTVTVSAGNITLKQGPVGGSTVDATVECDAAIAASGSRVGVIDTTVAACDTWGEVVDAINSQTNNWRAVILDGQRLDSANTVLATLAETAGAVNSLDGLALLGNSTLSFKQTLNIGNWVCPTGITGAATSCSNPRSMTFYIPGTTRTATQFLANPFAGKTRLVFRMTGTSTYASGTSKLELVCLAETYRLPASPLTGAAPTMATSSETVALFSIAGGATTVAATLDASPYGFACPRGQKMLAQINNSAVMTAATLFVAGHLF